MSSHQGRISSFIENDYLIEEAKIKQPAIIQWITPEPLTCAKFGCGKKLSITEQLYGGYCLQCQGGVKTVGKKEI